MELYRERQVPVSPTVARMARRFNIDLDSIVDEALTEHVLHQLTKSLTARAQSSLLAAREIAQQYGQSHVGCEHVFLAILLDQDSVPSQVVTRLKSVDELVNELRLVLKSESYNRKP